MKKIKVIELFAGVGGFRLGLEGWKGLSSSTQYRDPLRSKYEVVWSNQWEPLTKTVQHANIIYKERWPNSNHSEDNIESVIENEFEKIPDCNLLVGGFPCQDYSVAKQLNMSKGLIGKKGILWWSIYSILKRKKKKPGFLLLENVPRLLKSPRNNPGKDFYVILSCLNELGYAVEWRVINAAEYGAPQKRKRVYIFGAHRTTKYYSSLLKKDKTCVVASEGLMAKALEHSVVEGSETHGSTTLISKVDEAYKTRVSPFLDAGFLLEGLYVSVKSNARSFLYESASLGEVLQPVEEVEKKHFINFNQPLKKEVVYTWVGGKKEVLRTLGEKWRFLKGKKNIIKTNTVSGYTYRYNEGKMNLFDSHDKPSRTIVTVEYRKSPNRITHLVKQGKKIRLLTPLELEKLNMFPENHTLHPKLTDSKRGFLMGNALVVGIIEKIGVQLQQTIKGLGL